MPFEVWKTHMGTYRSNTTMQSFRAIYGQGGPRAFYQGLQPKLVESFLKGGVLLFSKEAIIRNCKGVGMSDLSSGLVGGFGGGVAQVSVVGPCTYLVTAAVTGDKNVTLMQRIAMTYRQQGIGGFYHGGTALMLRQGSNWASRQGLTDVIRMWLLRRGGSQGGHSRTRLTVAEEALAGVVGGALSTWNQPFEVLRIEAQAAAAKGLPARNIVTTARDIVRENGIAGLFQGILPRMGLCVGQTVFMVTIPYIMKGWGTK
jgi:hypothetical protein